MSTWAAALMSPAMSSTRTRLARPGQGGQALNPAGMLAQRWQRHERRDAVDAVDRSPFQAWLHLRQVVSRTWAALPAAARLSFTHERQCLHYHALHLRTHARTCTHAHVHVHAHANAHTHTQQIAPHQDFAPSRLEVCSGVEVLVQGFIYVRTEKCHRSLRVGQRWNIGETLLYLCVARRVDSAAISAAGDRTPRRSLG